MRKNNDNHNLLSSLRNLYGKLALLMQKISENTYHQFCNTSKTSNITSELNKQIDDLASKSIIENNYQDTITEKKIIHNTLNKNKDNEYQLIENTGKVNSIENKLYIHLKKSRTSSLTHPGIVEKLTESIWKHIHAAIRIARYGNKDKARLHSNIVEQALNELSHYMGNDDYSELVSHVEQYILELQKKE